MAEMIQLHCIHVCMVRAIILLPCSGPKNLNSGRPEGLRGSIVKCREALVPVIDNFGYKCTSIDAIYDIQYTTVNVQSEDFCTLKFQGDTHTCRDEG